MNSEFQMFSIFFFLKVLYFFQHFIIYVSFYVTLLNLISLTLRTVTIRKCRNIEHGPLTDSVVCTQCDFWLQSDNMINMIFGCFERFFRVAGQVCLSLDLLQQQCERPGPGMINRDYHLKQNNTVEYLECYLDCNLNGE